MRFVIISDTHGLQDIMRHPIPDGDVLIHCGDIGSSQSQGIFAKFNKWIGHYPHPTKICIAGNHDGWLEKTPSDITIPCLSNVTYLQDRMIEVGGFIIYGSPWTPEFCNWFFQLRTPAHARRIWERIPADTDILITHGPAYKILDETEDGDHVGCPYLLERIQDLKNLKLHCFGHIHEGAGVLFENGVHYVNASICTRNYSPINRAIVLDLEK